MESDIELVNRESLWEAEKTPLVILSEGCFGQSQSKLALGVIRYGNWPIVAVIDSTQTGKTVREVTGMPCDAPIVAELQDALAYTPKALLIGTAPPGGQLPEAWRVILSEALLRGLDIINGLHFFLAEDALFNTMAQQHQRRLWDVRNPDAYGQKFRQINLQKLRPQSVKTITMVGTDCSVGKMHTALELEATAKQQGRFARFIATGQTGILITGRGVPLDRVIGDFMAGALEVCIQEEVGQLQPNEPHLLLVEGQGSLMHPAYSGVTLSLLHGSNPDAMILCHKAGLTAIRNYPQVTLPSFREIIEHYESAARWVRAKDKPSAKVVGISVNTASLPEPEARRYLDQLAKETRLPVTDPVRYGVDTLLQAIIEVPNSSSMKEF